MRTRSLPSEVLLVACAALWVAASPASAGEITIELDLTDTTISALGGTVMIPPDGQIRAASAFLKVPGAGIVTPSAGAATVSLLTLNGTVDAHVFGSLADITGSLLATQVGSLAGSLTAGLSNLVFTPGNPLRVAVGGIISCMPSALCGLFGMFPVTLTGTQTINDTVTLAANNLSVNGSASVSATVTFTIASQSAAVNLIGREVGRTFVPEPGRLVQLAAGLGALAGLLWLGARRR